MEELDFTRGRKAQRLRRLLIVALVLALLLLFLWIWKAIGPGGQHAIRERAQPGAQPLYVERALAQQLLAVTRRAQELMLIEDKTMRIHAHALYRVENEDWRAACALLLSTESDLRSLAMDGQAGVRAASAYERLMTRRAEAQELRGRFEAAEMLRRGRLPEEMFAFLTDICELFAALQALPR